ncbi:tRNA threonylcarbamoyladenosine biosynthesis protein TsaB [hydrothermal vent metagenome]|uniref:tRNA threonylcarbamoyladenosine biosynthesis protein TsaB n=1 Tax=hydrothermal vent metagenome TaxID=652676 RepID=A0A3B0YA25_9ZZZZ
MSIILAIETATEACSAALFIDGDVRQRYQRAPRQHVALILPFIDELIAEAGVTVKQLDAVAFGRGPGSFTGLRIAAGITQGIAFGADLPVIPVSTLAALAQGAARQEGTDQVLTALDARMQEVYWGVYQLDTTGLMRLTGEEAVCAPSAVVCPEGSDWQAAGDGWSSYAEALSERLGFQPVQCFGALRPQAIDVALLAVDLLAAGKTVAPELASPIYLRNQVADKPRA